MRHVAVLGGGHGARTVAADITLAGHVVHLFEFERFHGNVAAIFDRHEITITGKARTGTAALALTTHDIAEAIAGVDIVLIVVPALYHRAYAEQLAPHLRDGQHIALIPGTFGSLEFVNEIRARGCSADITVSEFDTLPYATRIDGPASVHVYHNLASFGAGVFPARRQQEVFEVLGDLYPGVTPFRDVWKRVWRIAIR